MTGKSAQIRHRHIDVGDARLHLAEAGAGELVICLHGFPESWMSWRPQLESLGRDCLVVAPDNRGFNESSKPSRVEDYDMAHVTEDIRMIAAEYGVPGDGRKFTLAGHDWGGIAAYHFAARYPSMLSGLVILNAPHPSIFQQQIFDNPAQRANSQYISRLRDRKMESRVEAMGIDAFWTQFFGGHFARGAISVADRAAWLNAWRRPGRLTAMLNWYRASDIVVPAVGADNDKTSSPAAPSEPPLSATPVKRMEIDVPTMVIWGMQDTVLLPSLLDDLAAFVPELTIKKLADAGHGLLHEAPTLVTKHIRDFLQRGAKTQG